MTPEMLARIKALGRSPTSRAWLTNPIRALAWRVIQPYIEGVLRETARGTVDRTTARQLGERKNDKAIAHRLAALEAECEAIDEALASLTAALEAARAEAALARAEARAAAAAVSLPAAQIGPTGAGPQDSAAGPVPRRPPGS